MTKQTWAFTGVFLWEAFPRYAVCDARRVFTRSRYAIAHCDKLNKRDSTTPNYVTRTITARDFYGHALALYAQGVTTLRS